MNFENDPAEEPSTAAPTANWTEQEEYEDRIQLLDAEDLAELGIKKAISDLIEANPSLLDGDIEITERIDPQLPSYSVLVGQKTYKIFSPTLEDDEGEAWTRATQAFFQIVNSIRVRPEMKFYALYGGNDLMGIFLTDGEHAAIQKVSLQDCKPYLP